MISLRKHLLLLAISLCFLGTVSGAQYLIPVAPKSAPGAFGSMWTSELTLFNAGFMNASWYAPQCASGETTCADYWTGLPAGRIVKLHIEGINGAFMYTSVPEAAYTATPDDRLVMQFRIRDTSRQREASGTELPIVNVADFSRKPIQLLDVPTTPGFRILLRVYSTGVATARVRVYGDSSADALSEVRLLLQRAETRDPSLHPFYAQLDPIPVNLDADHVRVEIATASADMPDLWAFITVTNNETQQVTAITPQPVSHREGCSNPAPLTISVTPLHDPETFLILVVSDADIDAVLGNLRRIDGVTNVSDMHFAGLFLADIRPIALEAVRCVPGLSAIEQGRTNIPPP